ncbi:hypothetical protein C5U62_02865 [Pseudomonas protegens]|uniref:DUF4435 domain-containing protein n=1 Tax=Pseudomonas protegens TaxID=380021 RepID=A0A2T6GS12_9PSED|nr:DUF4435 domain-containing protein [Pseudomonas protegens]PUA46936.1 hypothetical protein C5U62_02865 [Pseudomonas protegens]
MPVRDFAEGATLDYSDEATNTLDAFMECDYILFVEGDDDVLFWNTVITRCSKLNVDIRPVGGVNELKPYVEKVRNGVLDCVVAQDADYSVHIGEKRHSRVLYTYGYSIENTLYNPELVTSLLGVWSKKQIDASSEVSKWLEDLVNSCTPLFYLDFLNAKKKLEIDTGAGHCQRFMVSKNSEKFDRQKVSSHVERISKQHALSLSSDELSCVKNVPILVLMRGHFLQSAVLRYINCQLKLMGRKTSVSGDALYAHAIQYLQNCFDWSSTEGQYYSKQISVL